VLQHQSAVAAQGVAHDLQTPHQERGRLAGYCSLPSTLPGLQQVGAGLGSMLWPTARVSPVLLSAGRAQDARNHAQAALGVQQALRDQQAQPAPSLILPSTEPLRFTAAYNFRYLLSCLYRKWHSCHWLSECDTSNSALGCVSVIGSSSWDVEPLTVGLALATLNVDS
jgi:hypothetical protein